MPARQCLDCGTIQRHGSRCESCTLARQRATDARRGSATQRGYGPDWRRRSARVIREEGRCRDCGHTGSRENPLTCDHIIPKARGGSDARENLCCRCRVHNSARRPSPRPRQA